MSDVGCVGILVADTFCGPMEELPQQGQLLLVDGMLSQAGGCAANVALDLVKQGVSVEVGGCLGRDAGAEVVTADLKNGGVGCSQLIYSDVEATSQTVILIVKGQDRRYIHALGANKAFQVDHIARAWVAGLKVLYIGGLFALPGIQVEALAGLLQFARSQGVTTVVDVVVPQEFSDTKGLSLLLPHTDFFLPNDDEGRQMTSCIEPQDQLRSFAALGANTVIITLGEGGAVASHRGNTWTCQPYEVSSVDPSGAGDAFAAGIVTGILQGWEMPQMLAYAAALGASATTAVGTTAGVFTASQAEAFVTSQKSLVAASYL